jgi:hypothetical protein
VKGLKEIIEELNELVEFAESVIAWIFGSLRTRLCGITATRLSVVIENCKPTSSARSKRVGPANPQCT